jgi:hypothetical protein
MNAPKLLPQLLMMLTLSAGAAGLAQAAKADHQEFEATLHVPFVADSSADPDHPEARTFKLAFDFPWVELAQDVTWQLELVGPNNVAVQQWQGVQALGSTKVELDVAWDGRANGVILENGLYEARLKAVSHDAVAGAVVDASATEVGRVLAAAGTSLVEQDWEFSVGQSAAPAIPAFKALATSAAPVAATTSSISARSIAATASLAYTVYYGNLHSQTNHSDGGGVLTSCTGAQNPQAGAYGPATAYAYAKGKGLDFLMASEHNHMYDGSDGTNTAAVPATARALYQSGLTAATTYNSANAGFLAMYGLEWGVISNGGHMNIFNSPELLGWEYNASGALIADTLTTKNDYAAMYTLMAARGWVGQFNHPESTGQFLVNSTPFGYTADGDTAMALCEVLNTSAYSTNTTETETSNSSYNTACNKALEAGYHVAFSSDQDNHCGNWGASYTNRTAVLIPTGTALNSASMIAAIKARRVFATMDKTAQLILTANGHLMGERFTNTGTLTLVANFASTSGKTISSVKVYEGVPGRNGTVTQLSTTASTTITPAAGVHFYYVKLTQSDGNILWSAPVWVTQS